LKIHEYASKGDIDGVRKELRRGAKVDVRNEQDFTPLACAISSPAVNEQMLQLLIEAGANVNAAVDDSKTFLIGLAADSGDLEKLQCLLDAGADVNIASPKGYTTLIYVMYHLQDDEKLLPVVDLLVKHGARIECETSYGESPLSVPAQQGRFHVVKYLLDAGADPSGLNWTPLILATVVGTVDELENILDGNADLKVRDCFGRTAWLWSAILGDLQKAQLLLAKGADLKDQERMGGTALANCVARGHVEMARWLIDVGADVESSDDSGNTPLIVAAQAGATEGVRLLLQAGADPSRRNTYNDNAMSMAISEPIFRQLAQAGEDINDISKEIKRTLTHMEGGDTLNVSQAQYLSGRYPRFGRSNPEVMKIPFWHEMVRTGLNAYQGKKQFNDATYGKGAVWSFDRFGTSFTEIPDGRFVQIAGEHEDYYDPDFCIYNDVIVHEPSGKFKILGYPKDVFSPTDFHSATYFNGFIYIIGSLGYHGERHFGTTPIYRVNCKTWKIEAVPSSGENPGWIYKHKGALTNQAMIVISGGTICDKIDGEEQNIDNTERFNLDLATMNWTQIR
jgi:ankyrin repeat protein